jgi:hypothetical protein
MDSPRSWSEIVDGITTMATGLGLVTLALFPLALPLLLLTIAATLPLVLPIALVGALAAILWVVWVGIRVGGRAVRRLWSVRARSAVGVAIGQPR